MLTLADAKKLRMRLCETSDAKTIKLPAAKAGYVIPYFDLDGKQTKFYRYRYLEDTRTGFAALTAKKPLRYGQPANSINEVYLPPLTSWRRLAGAPAIPLLITEGERKSACATKHGLPTMGLGGVWVFQSNKATQPLLPIFNQFQWAGRDVYIVFDSDAATNPSVVAAENRLAKRLTELGAVVRIGRIPQANGSKVGIDDYIVAHGVEQFKSDVLDNAELHAQAEALHSMNERVVYVRDPGLIWDHKNLQRISPQAFTGHAFSNQWYFETRQSKQGETMVRVKTAQAWLEWEQRAEVPKIDFCPGEGRITDHGLLNTWSGWPLGEPVEGDVSPWHELMENIFGEQKYAKEWFEQWCAYPLQHPGAKMTTAALIWSVEHGTGKTFVGNALLRIYGVNGAELKDSDLDDERNEWAADKQFVLFDDITGRGDRKLGRRLMTMITQKYIRMNPKFIPSYSISDRINYFFTSNDPDALFMEDHDRRFFIQEVQGDKLDDEFRYRFVAWLESDEGARALWAYFMDLDMSGFDPYGDAFITDAKREMISVGKSHLAAWIEELRTDPESTLRRVKAKGDLFTAKELIAWYDPMGDKKVSANAIARELKRAGFLKPATGNDIRTRNGKMISTYVIQNASKWKESTWSAACDHYNENHPDVTGAKY